MLAELSNEVDGKVWAWAEANPRTDIDAARTRYLFIILSLRRAKGPTYWLMDA
jgi:hypothetical protein